MEPPSTHVRPPDVVTSCQPSPRVPDMDSEITDNNDIAFIQSTEECYFSMENVKKAVQTLKLHTEVHILAASLRDLRGWLEEYHTLDPRLLASLESQRVHEDVLICMHNFRSNEDIQKESCDLLTVLMELSTEVSKELITKDRHQQILHVLTGHLCDVGVQIAALGTLTCFLQSAAIRKKVLYGSGDVMGHVTRAMTAFPETPELQSAACRLLNVLLQEDANFQTDLIRHGDHKLILDALQTHPTREDVTREACKLLHLVTNEATAFLTVLDGIVQTLIQDRVHVAMVNAIRHHNKCEETLVSAYGVLSGLSFEEDVLHTIGSRDLETGLLSASMKYIRNADIQFHCFNIFANILTYDDELTYERAEGQELHWLKQVYIAMTQHREVANVQVACCRVLAQLMELYPDLTENIGEDTDHSQDPIHILCFGALLMHHNDASVAIAVFNAIYWLSADNEHIQKQLVQKNTYIGVIHAMKVHGADPAVQEAGCRALRGLSIFSQENKETISWHGDLSDIFRPLFQFPNHPEVVVEAIAVLACLADTELVRTMCLVEQVHERIHASMEAHEDSPLLHEVSLEALSILCAADGGTTALNEAGATERVLASMKAHWNNSVIQRKGLVLLQLLLDEVDLSTRDDLSSDLAKVITAAMSQNEEEIGLQTEGCVAILILAQKGDFASVHLVESQAHAHLFYILDHFQDQRKLLDLANECLYVLGCEKNLKSQMLLYACAQGFSKGVECLIQLGAEVNVGAGTDTPLCHACCHGDEHIVGLLLRQGVTDLQEALQLVLRLQHHSLVGLILSHFDHQGGIVSWGGLGLGDLRPEWLEPTFLGRAPRGWQVSESGKQMAQKIQRTEQRRAHRAQRHLSAPEAVTTSGRRMSLRYSFQSKPRFGNKEEFVQKLQENYPPLKDKETDEHDEEDVPRRRGPLSTIKRKIQSLRRRRKSSPAITTANRDAIRKRSDLIRSLSTSTFSLFEQEKIEGEVANEDVAEFAQCPFELREWKETTLTGSNVPFSSLDPRRSKEKAIFRQPQAFPGEWQRKSPFRKARRHSESVLMIPHLLRSASRRSLLSLSGGSQQGDGDDSSGSSQGGSSVPGSDLNTGSSLTSRFLAPLRGLGRKRAYTSRPISETALAEAENTVFTMIKDDPFTTNTSEGEATTTETTSIGNTSKHPQDTSKVLLPVRRSRSVTFGDPLADSRISQKITHFDLSNNSIRDFRWLFADGDTPLLNKFKFLEKVDLSSNQLKFIPDALFRFFSNLRHLVVADNQLRHLPPATLNCANLTSIDISNNQLEDVTLFASHMTVSLKELNMSKNALQSFPHWITKSMPKLETLNLNSNKINFLPKEPLILKSLRSLDMSYNHIRVVPDLLLSQTHALETLALSGNEIDNLPSEELASILLKLAVVKLSHNHLTGKEPFYVPKFLLELKSLRSLDVSYNQLHGLPEPRLWKATMLREINASHNSIKKLTLSQPRHWSTLERLVLAHNKLVELPREIGQLTSLTSLDVSHNEKLTTIPDEMGRLQKLWELSLEGLKMDLDEGLTKGRTKDLIGYLHEKLKRSVEYYHMKMMVVGYGGRGKSTLLRSLMRQRQPDRSLPTVGVVLRDWTFRGRSPRAGSGTVTYTLNTWDFAGQEEFYSTHQCFLSNRALYLVIYNLSKGVSEVETLRPWLVNIQARAPNCPVIVVGTHVDLLPKENRDDIVSSIRQRISEMCEGPGFPVLQGLMEVNCTQEGTAIDRLRILIKDVLDNFKVRGQHVMGQKIPESYVRLQELLSEEAKNLRSSLPIIKHGRLVKIAKDAELDLDEEELQQAVRFLHEAGSLLHYDDAALQLNSLYFIDPEWLCRMMAQVVTVREINPFINKHGIMRKENVRHLFTGKRVGEEAPYTFPPSLIPQYLRLLERFEIALPQNEDELMIPSRLPLEHPVFVHPIPDPIGAGKGSAPCLVQRRYVLSYTPIGFWSRLLTRILVFVNSKSQLNLIKGRPTEVTYWREGIYVYYNQDAFFLVESEHETSDVIVIRVPGTKLGARLLGEVVDHVDILMEEWYPGLQEMSPTGESLVKVQIPCPYCQESDHVFVLEELIGLSDLDDFIDCPVHKGQVPLSLLAPDVVLGDMDEAHFLTQEDFTFVQSPEYVLGEGTFGCVYRAQYRKQSVAVKIFNKMGDGHPYKMMRQEATILRQLHHPSLVGLVGFGLRPRVVVLELAPLGSLGSLLKSERIRTRSLQQRIATQVADGLQFLHDHSIIYRDMKPDNILMFNLSLAAVINAKISDYGISRLATPYGLTLPEGTPGYRGPEVVKGEPYSVQADMYSFGVTLYELVTGGQHPFSDLGFQSEIDDAVIKGRRVDPVTKKGAAPWPDMEDLIDRCLHPVPDQRPTSSQVLETLKGVELLTLRRAVAVSKGVSVECMLVRGYGENDLEVWVASGQKDGAQLSWMSLTAHTHEPKGMMFTGSRILCMEAVGQSNVLLGTQAGTICVYDAWQHCCKHTLRPLGDSILCLKIYGGYESQDLVFVGLADGRLAIFSTKNIISDSEALPTFLRVGEVQEPLRVIEVDRRSRRLYLGAGSKLHAVRVEPTIEIEESFDTKGHSQSTKLISQLVVQGKYAHVGKKGDSRIEMWHLSKHKLQRSIDLDTCIDSSEGEENRHARVTSMLLVGKSSLWVGTGEGYVVLIDSATYQHLLTIRRHTSSVRALAWARVFDQFSLVLAGGLGFSVQTQSHEKDDDDHGYLTMWDPDISQHKKFLEEHDRRRQDWRSVNSAEHASDTKSRTGSKGLGQSNLDAPKGRRTSLDAYTKIVQNKAKQPGPGKVPERHPHRRHSQIPVYQRNDSQSIRPALSGQGPGVKRGSLTPNLEYGRSKRESLSMHVAKAEVHKRTSLHQAFSFDSSPKPQSLEIGNLMKLRRKSSSVVPKVPALLEGRELGTPRVLKKIGSDRAARNGSGSVAEVDHVEDL